MGKAMLIICSGLLISLAYRGFGTSSQERQLIQRGAGYAKHIHAKNAAHTAIQIAMNKINDDSTFIDEHYSEGTAWEDSINGADVDLYVERFYTSPTFFDPDSIRLISMASFMGIEDVKVASVYLKNPYQQYVEPFKSPLTIATDNYNLNVSGSASLSGIDQSGQCDEDQADSTAAVTITDPADQDSVESSLSGVDTEGTETVSSDTSLSYDPTDELIERLEQSPDAQTLSGDVKGELGTADNPGVFFVDGSVKITGNTVGYGILVIQAGGNMQASSDSLSVAGTFDFHGLVIFEDALSFDGKGTPTIYGSVLVGETDDYTGEPIDIDINGNMNLQYDCLGEDYAKMAASTAIKQNKFTRVVTYE